jgi:hypothetical protein
MRWPMQTPTRSQRVNRAIATTFVMHAMVGRRSLQLKMPHPDAYGRPTTPSSKCADGVFDLRYERREVVTRRIGVSLQKDPKVCDPRFRGGNAAPLVHAVCKEYRSCRRVH